MRIQGDQDGGNNELNPFDLFVRQFGPSLEAALRERIQRDALSADPADVMADIYVHVQQLPLGRIKPTDPPFRKWLKRMAENALQDRCRRGPRSS